MTAKCTLTFDGLTVEDFPWIDRYVVEKDVHEREGGDEEREKLMRRYLRFWHPDKFMLTFGKRVEGGDAARAAVREKVDKVSAEIGRAKVRLSDYVEEKRRKKSE